MTNKELIEQRMKEDREKIENMSKEELREQLRSKLSAKKEEENIHNCFRGWSKAPEFNDEEKVITLPRNEFKRVPIANQVIGSGAIFFDDADSNTKEEAETRYNFETNAYEQRPAKQSSVVIPYDNQEWIKVDRNGYLEIQTPPEPGKFEHTVRAISVYGLAQTQYVVNVV